MVLSFNKYISDVGLVFRVVPVIFSNNNTDFDVFNLLDEQSNSELFEVKRTCYVEGLTLRKIEITGNNFLTDFISYPYPFGNYAEIENNLKSLITDNKIKNYRLIGEIKNSFRLETDINVIYG